MSPTAFDAQYYERFYSHDRVHTAARIDGLVRGLLGMADWWGIEIKSVLDVGAGMGRVGDALAAQRPRVRYRGTDVSAYACRTYGHLRVDIASWAPKRPYDLSVCLSVLQYLDDAAFLDAVANLATATRHLMYLEIPTRWDRSNSIDAAATDLEVYWRSGAWYRKQLSPWFVQVGAGMWARRGGAVPMFELEAAR
jgi:SAM-dependent methyltransferase